MTGIQGDVDDAANLEDLDRLFDTVKRETGNIDVLYASAGMWDAAKLGDMTEKHFDKIVGLSTRGTLCTVRRHCRCSTKAVRSC